MKKLILATDGGGMKGLITAAFLDSRPRGFPDLDDFDLLSGTSTGGIIALGIRMGLSPASMVDYYRTNGPRIFPKGPRRVKLFKRNRYNTTGLSESLREVFEDRRLKDDDRPVLIPALDWRATERQDAAFFFEENSPFSYFSAARATSAAPTYFQAYALNQRLLVDGGLAMNNPAMGAVTHARELWPDDELEVWSVGTGREPGKEHRYPFTTVGMLDDVLELSMSGAAGIVHKELSVDRSLSYIRYDFNLQKGVPLDDARPDTLALFMSIARNPVKRADTRKMHH